ncbi:LuxR C-terminal-related transcriptional regulator [Qingshengfaniella alkalisoli]|uniref:PAS domain S-box protein n=1 Tax=Qingshengfaniella alkalisoli TaxID=2599296 RepID=A0A5B8J4P3_9RHOB|nr:LuxR C-terminal-related transcriptional regulator [Qingshengfaniella alkalisoli]QDY71668.1 PAS domain S-box protein [Qingshengfaniella alkalisoli]
MTTFDTLAHLAFDSAPVGLVLTEDRVVRACNQTFADLSGFSVEELVGQSFRQLYDSDEEFAQVRDIGLAALRRQKVYSDLRILRRKDGSAIWCRFRARSLTPEAPLARTVLSYSMLADAPTRVNLTPRERDVVMLLMQGMTSKQIAGDLGLSPRTIEDVRARLLRKFGVHNAAELLNRLTNIEL